DGAGAGHCLRPPGRSAGPRAAKGPRTGLALAQGRAGSRNRKIMKAPVKLDTERSISRHMLAGLVIVIVLAGGVGGWAGTMTLSGALIAQGSVVVDTNVKKVQHPTGGIVGQLNVRDGDHVKQ